MVTMAEHQALEARVEKLEQHENEDLAGCFSVLRVYLASHQDESMRAGMLALLARIERRARPLGLALERAERRAAAREQLLDEATR